MLLYDIVKVNLNGRSLTLNRVRSEYIRTAPNIMKQELTIAKRQRTVQRRTFGDLRGEMKTVLRTVNRNSSNANPNDWDRLILGVIRNRSKSPVKFKLPKIGIVLTEFDKLPAGKIDMGCLTAMYDTASIRQHQGRGGERRFGSERWLMRETYGKLLSAVERKIYQKIELEGQAGPGPQVRAPVQLKLPIETHSASDETKRA